MKWNVNLYLFILTKCSFSQPAGSSRSFISEMSYCIIQFSVYTHISSSLSWRVRFIISVLEIRKWELKISQDKQFKWTELEPKSSDSKLEPLSTILQLPHPLTSNTEQGHLKIQSQLDHRIRAIRSCLKL